jgi:hypothetical protein
MFLSNSVDMMKNLPIFLCQRRMGHGVFKIAISSNFFGAFMSHIIFL